MQSSIYAECIEHHNAHIQNATPDQIGLWNFLSKLNVEQKQ